MRRKLVFQQNRSLAVDRKLITLVRESMKEPDVTARWIAAGKCLASDPKAHVSCPACENDLLVVQDVKMSAGDLKFERLMSCPSCGARNLLFMNRRQ